MTPESTPPDGFNSMPLPGQTQEDPRRIPSHAILSGDREVIVEHRGSDYRLRVTANGKLILTK